jgi:hypothetical protein
VYLQQNVEMFKSEKSEDTHQLAVFGFQTSDYRLTPGLYVRLPCAVNRLTWRKVKSPGGHPGEDTHQWSQ